MANYLVPYTQDEQKWKQHYMEQAMKQIKPKDMMKQVKEEKIHPNYILPTMQLVTQAESEMKRQKEPHDVYAPIKATPEFESPHSVTVTTKRSTSKHKAPNTTSKSKNKKRMKAQQGDIFH